MKNRKRRVLPRATLPTAAERLYVGFARAWAAEVNEKVLVSIAEQTDFRFEPLQRELGLVRRLDADEPTFLDTISGFGNRVISGLRFQFAAFGAKAERVGNEVAKHAKRQLKRVLGIAPETITTGHSVDFWRRENVKLITKMTTDQLELIRKILERLGSAPVEVVAKDLQKALHLTKRRAELIARDQVLKLNAQITEDAHRQAGIVEYIWSTSKDDSVRDGHAALEGRRFRYDDPPIVDVRSGRRANPGQDYECRCVAVPYLPELA